MLNPQAIKKDFPIFTRHPHLVYLDAAATSLKPSLVIETTLKYLAEHSTNVGRGLYPLAEKTTEAFEAVRAKMATFIGAASAEEIIFTSGATGSINLASELLASSVGPHANIVVTALEHHSNFLPWYALARKKQVEFRIAPLDQEGHIDKAAFAKLIDTHTAIVAFSAVSNVTGAISPVADLVSLVKNTCSRASVLVDAAQAVGHLPVDVTKWGADLVAFSAHKMYGPTGVGVLYGKRVLLRSFSPVTFGGGMVLDAYPMTHPNDQTRAVIYKDSPHRFEAGTPNIAGVIALGAAVEYIAHLEIANIREHERALTVYALKRLQEAFGDAILLLGPRDIEARSGIVAFTLKHIHPHDIAHILGERGLSVRAGEHCAAPLHRAFGLEATTRLSFSVYNTEDDIERCIESMRDIQTLLAL